MARITDPYVKKKLGETYTHGIGPCISGVCQIVVGLVGLAGVLLTLIARQAMKLTIKPDLKAKKPISLQRIRGPVFIAGAVHPHKTRTDKELPEWKPIETPSTLQKREVNR